MLLLHKNQIGRYRKTDSCLEQVFSLIQKGGFQEAPEGRVDCSKDLYYMVQKYQTKEWKETVWESHKSWIDVQYLLSGKEEVGIWTMGDALQLEREDAEADCCFYREKETKTAGDESILRLHAGMLAVFYPEDIHRPCGCVKKPDEVRKVVFKLRIR